MAKDIDELYDELDHLPNQERKYKRSRKGTLRQVHTIKWCSTLEETIACL